MRVGVVLAWTEDRVVLEKPIEPETLRDLLGRIAVASAAFSQFVIQATGIGYAKFEGDLEALRATMEQDGGSLVILSKSNLDAWGSPGDALPLMRAVKEQFDPKGTLNPGRFVGGI